ncbi:DUF4231 domain-containing protein [Nocardia fluminea]|uniref:DUF4231 domain-containing protein n=1 Tax=Nocardia fluminea TaxID=134984 RepID=UPI0036720AF8
MRHYISCSDSIEPREGERSGGDLAPGLGHPWGERAVTVVEGARADESDPIWDRLIEQLRWYSARSRSAQRWYKAVKVVQICIGAIVPVLAMQASAVVTAAVATVVVAAEGMQQVFQWHANWLRYRATAESLKYEKYMFLSATGPYASAPGRSTLAQRIEAIAKQETLRWESDNALGGRGVETKS